MASRYQVVAESEHEFQNPLSPEKLRMLGERLGLGQGSRVPDVASGRGGPAVFLARTFGCTVEGVENEPAFHGVAVERAAAREVSHLVSFQLADASIASFAEGEYDAAICLGATFVYGGLAPTVAALAPVVKPGGHVAVGECYWRRLPLPDDYVERNEPYTTLEDTVLVFETERIPVVSMIASSENDWDVYETLHWQAVARWLAENPDDPDASEILAQNEHWRRTYLRHGRDFLGWAIFVGWKRA